MRLYTWWCLSVGRSVSWSICRSSKILKNKKKWGFVTVGHVVYFCSSRTYIAKLQPHLAGAELGPAQFDFVFDPCQIQIAMILPNLPCYFWWHSLMHFFLSRDEFRNFRDALNLRLPMEKVTIFSIVFATTSGSFTESIFIGFWNI